LLEILLYQNGWRTFVLSLLGRVQTPELAEVGQGCTEFLKKLEIRFAVGTRTPPALPSFMSDPVQGTGLPDLLPFDILG
jgi:hypothetical protein